MRQQRDNISMVMTRQGDTDKHGHLPEGVPKGKAQVNSLGRCVILDYMSQVESYYNQYNISENHYDNNSLFSFIGHGAMDYTAG